MKSKKIIAFISALACFVSVTACEKNVNKKENTKKENEENFNAFIKVLARLVQKYGPTVLEEIKKEEEVQYE